MKSKKSLGNRIWEFMISMVGIFGFLSLMKVRIEQGIIYAVFVGGIIVIALNHIISFFQNLDENIKYIKNMLEKDEDKEG